MNSLMVNWEFFQEVFQRKIHGEYTVYTPNIFDIFISPICQKKIDRLKKYKLINNLSYSYQQIGSC